MKRHRLGQFKTGWLHEDGTDITCISEFIRVARNSLLAEAMRLAFETIKSGAA